MLTEEVEKRTKEILVFALKKTKGNVMQTAKFIGRTTQHTYGLIKKYQINLARYRK